MPSSIPREEISKRVVKWIIDNRFVEASRVTADAHFTDDMGMDNQEIFEVYMGLETEFDIKIPDEETAKIMSVPDAVRYISSRDDAK